MKLSGAPTIILFTFLGGLFGYLTPQVEAYAPSTKGQWISILVGAAMAGVSAVTHYYQTPPPAAKMTMLMRKL
jgi:hypothetical protein